MNIRPALPLLLAAALSGTAAPAVPALAAGAAAGRPVAVALLLGETEVATFREISGLESAVEIIEYRNEADPVTHKQMGKARYKNIVLKGGTVSDASLRTWFDSALAGTVERKSGSIVYLDREGNEVLRCAFADAYPAAYEVGARTAPRGHPAVESFELACGYLERVAKPAQTVRSSASFTVEIDGNEVRGIRAMSAVKATVFDAGDQSTPSVNVGNMTLVLDPAADPALHAWFQGVAKGNDIRKSITVVLRNARGQPERTYTYHECWPCRWKAPELNSSSDTYIVEEIEFVVERIERG